MKSVSLVISSVIVLSSFFLGASAYAVSRNTVESESVTGRPIQIVTLENHSFELQVDRLKSILEQDDLKDRKLVIVSIAGSFRKGKSFLLNYFLKYLYAQYQTHDVSDWIGQFGGGVQIEGFKARGGPERETTGIWMWSELFTYDSPDGEKKAIMVVDTQGIFDDESSMKDCTAIFAISMMISSVQCYNVMQNIQEDDFQTLEMFTEYGRLAMQQTNEAPFQNLLFLVRDWPYPKRFPFGDGQRFIDNKFRGNEKQSVDMRKLRTRIQESFENIGGFLLPYPGSTVAQSENATSITVSDIDPRFIMFVKRLVPSIFAPEKLVVKKVNGREIRAGDLVTYLQSYVNIFNSDQLPEPKTVLTATAEANNAIFHAELVKKYLDSMEQSLDAVPYLEQANLLEAHNRAKEAVMNEFLNQRKLGDEQMNASFRRKLANEIEEKYKTFENINNRQRSDYIAKKEAEEKAAEEERKKQAAEAKAIEEARLKEIAQRAAEEEEKKKLAAEEREKAEKEAKEAAQLKAEEEAKEREIANAKAEQARKDKEKADALADQAAQAKEEAEVKAREAMQRKHEIEIEAAQVKARIEAENKLMEQAKKLAEERAEDETRRREAAEAQAVKSRKAIEEAKERAKQLERERQEAEERAREARERQIKIQMEADIARERFEQEKRELEERRRAAERRAEEAAREAKEKADRQNAKLAWLAVPIIGPIIAFSR